MDRRSSYIWNVGLITVFWDLIFEMLKLFLQPKMTELNKLLIK
jgi:hypothetical protein